MGNKCNYCSHEWVSRKKNPKCCPKCKNYNYNVPRKKKEKKGIDVNCKYCGKSFYIAQWEIRAKRKLCSAKCSNLFKAGKPNLKIRGENNGQWKDNQVKNGALHDYIKYHLPKPDKCQDCGEHKKLDLANISQEYKREFSDWEWLCRRCHMMKDGRANILPAYNLGRSRKLKEKINISNSLKGKPKSEEWIAKARERKLTEEHINIIKEHANERERDNSGKFI